MKIGIIGTGAFSVSVAIRLIETEGNTVDLWSEDASLVKEFKKTKKLTKIFKEKEIPLGITVSNNITDVISNKDILFIMPRILYFEKSIVLIEKTLDKKIPLVIGTKGMNENGLFPYQILRKHVKNPYSVMSGPTFAEDLVEPGVVGFTLASLNKRCFRILKQAFQKSQVVIEESKDLKGVSLSGVLKNVYAIGAGILAGVPLRESSKAFYFTKVFSEFSEILYHFFGNEETLYSLAGLGDLLLTCHSPSSRNYTFGEFLGKKRPLKEIEEYREKNTIEGVSSLPYLLPLLRKYHLKTPLIDGIFETVMNPKMVDAFLEILSKD